MLYIYILAEAQWLLWKPMMDVHNKLNWYSFLYLYLWEICTYYCIIMFISFITVVYRSQHYELLLIWKWSRELKYVRNMKREIRQHLNGQKFNWKILSDCNDGMMPQMCEPTLEKFVMVLLLFLFTLMLLFAAAFMFTKCTNIYY